MRLKMLHRIMQGKDRVERRQVHRRKDFIARAPADFSLLQNKEAVFRFINIVDGLYKKEREVFIDLKSVHSIDYPAILVLLSVMARFRDKKIRFNGNYPDNQEVKDKLIESRFFHHLFNLSSPASIGDLKVNNHIYTKTDVEVDPVLGEQIMREASTTIWNKPRICKGLQTVLIELMHNTNNHAANNTDDKEKWYLLVNHDADNNKVCFVFVDYGQGIFESLRVNWETIWKRLTKRIEYGTNSKILEDILNGIIKLTDTKQPNRGKGLKRIKKALDWNQISNLYIFSNDVSVNACSADYTQLKNSFSGTLFYWELQCDNLNTVWEA